MSDPLPNFIRFREKSLLTPEEERKSLIQIHDLTLSFWDLVLQDVTSASLLKDLKKRLKDRGVFLQKLEEAGWILKSKRERKLFGLKIKTQGLLGFMEKYLKHAKTRLDPDLYKDLSKINRELSSLKHIFISKQIGLIIRVASSIMSRSSPQAEMSDLISEGFFGAIRALELFDVNMGFRYSTYAGTWIRQYIGRALVSKAMIREPFDNRTKRFQISAYRRQYAGLYGEEPTTEEIAKKMDVDSDSIEKIEAPNKYGLLVSLDTPVNKGGEFHTEGLLIDTIPSNNPSPDSGIFKSEETKVLLTCIEELSLRDQDILKKRYGIGFQRPQTLSEIGSGYNLSRERIRQIESAALHHLKSKYKNAITQNRSQKMKCTAQQQIFDGVLL